MRVVEMLETCITNYYVVEIEPTKYITVDVVDVDADGRLTKAYTGINGLVASTKERAIRRRKDSDFIKRMEQDGMEFEDALNLLYGITYRE